MDDVIMLGVFCFYFGIFPSLYDLGSIVVT